MKSKLILLFFILGILVAFTLLGCTVSIPQADPAQQGGVTPPDTEQEPTTPDTEQEPTTPEVGLRVGFDPEEAPITNIMATILSKQREFDLNDVTLTLGYGAYRDEEYESDKNDGATAELFLSIDGKEEERLYEELNLQVPFNLIYYSVHYTIPAEDLTKDSGVINYRVRLYNGGESAFSETATLYYKKTLDTVILSEKEGEFTGEGALYVGIGDDATLHSERLRIAVSSENSIFDKENAKITLHYGFFRYDKTELYNSTSRFSIRINNSALTEDKYFRYRKEYEADLAEAKYNCAYDTALGEYVFAYSEELELPSSLLSEELGEISFKMTAYGEHEWQEDSNEVTVYYRTLDDGKIELYTAE